MEKRFTFRHVNELTGLWVLGTLAIVVAGVMISGHSQRWFARQYAFDVLLPEADFANFKRPEPFIPKSLGHHAEWIHACKTGDPTTCNFEYAGWLTEANHLGNVAYRTGKKIEWDSVALKATNAPESAPLIHREYRKGWKLA